MKTGLKDLDPRTKLVMVLCLSTLGVFIQDVIILAAVLCVSVVLSAASGSRLFVLIKKFRHILWLFVAIAIIQSVFAPSGRILLSLGGIKLITAGGLYKGVAMVLRMSVVMVSATIMATSNSGDCPGTCPVEGSLRDCFYGVGCYTVPAPFNR